MSAEIAEKPDINEMRVIHRVFRREFSALPGLVRGTGDGDVARAAVVGGHAELMLTFLDVHHSGEDENLWPLLLARATPSTELVNTMQAQHERVHESLGRAEDLLTAWRQAPDAETGEPLACSLEELSVALLEHLDQEEQEILPLVEDHVSIQEWAALGEHGRDSTPQEKQPIVFGAILEEATPEERTKMLSPLPPPAREFLTTAGADIYRQYIEQVRGG